MDGKADGAGEQARKIRLGVGGGWKNKEDGLALLHTAPAPCLWVTVVKIPPRKPEI